MSGAKQNPGALAELPAESDLREPWEPYAELQCRVTLEIPVLRFNVRDLLALEPGTIVATSWLQFEQVPVRVNGEAIAVAKFEPVNDRMCVRVGEVL